MTGSCNLCRYLVASALVMVTLVGFEHEIFAQSFVRVLADQAPVRTGPSASNREVYRANRGEVLEVVERGNREFWFRVKLEDGTTGWMLGEFVFPFDVGPASERGIFAAMGSAISNALLGPSPVSSSTTSLSFSAGMLDGEGMFLLRPSRVIDPLFAMEGFVGVSPRSDKIVVLAGIGPVLRLAPGAPVGPFVALGIGAANIRPKADNFVDAKETVMALAAGGGFEITFKKQITARIDARSWTLFDNNRANSAVEVSGGLAIFF
jgi:hypothetical protein